MINPSTVPNFDDPTDGFDTDTEPVTPDPTDPGTDPLDPGSSPGGDVNGPDWTDGQSPDPTTMEWIMLPAGSSVATVDFDLDGHPDRILVDTSGDGIPDIVVERTETGFREYYDGDLVTGFGTVTDFTDEEMWAMDPELYTYMTGEVGPPAGGGTEPLEPTEPGSPTEPTEPAGPGGPTDPTDPTVVDGQIIGDPFAYGDDWFYQSFNGSCVPAVVAQIFSQYTGEQVTDLDFVELANQEGAWVVGPDGVPGLYPEGAAELLEAAGIPATHKEFQDINDLAGYLEPPPHAVMVAVDADVFWYGESADQVNHAVLITGIDVQNGIVYISDTGTPDGNMMEVSLDDFLEAWEVGNSQIVVTDVSVDEFQAQAGSPAGPGSPEDVYDPQPGDIGSKAANLDAVAGWVSDNKWALIPAVIEASSIRK